MKAELEELFEKAKAARANSYSPYSGCRVGAAIRTENGEVFSGCNVENSSYGLTVCAERSAISSAVSHGHTKIREILVVTDSTPAWPPCGMCRQVIAEFSEPGTRIHVSNLKGELESLTLDDLLPRAFSPQHLMRGKK